MNISDLWLLPEAVPLRKMPLNKIPSVPQNESLLGILDKFQEGRSHIAVVSRQSVEKARSVQEAADVVKRSLRQRLKETVGMTDSDSDSNESQEGDEKEKKSKRSRRKKDDIESGASTLGSRSPKKPTMNLEQSMPDDAVLGEEGAKEVKCNVHVYTFRPLILSDISFFKFWIQTSCPLGSSRSRMYLKASFWLIVSLCASVMTSVPSRAYRRGNI